MTTRLVCLVTLAALALHGSIIVGAESEKKTEEKAVAPTAVYVCPMHADVRATWGCKCPHCGMALVQAKGDATHGHGCGCAWCVRPVAKEAAADMAAKLLVLKDELGLTDEQVKRLEALAQQEKAKDQPATDATPQVQRRAGCCGGCCGR